MNRSKRMIAGFLALSWFMTGAAVAAQPKTRPEEPPVAGDQGSMPPESEIRNEGSPPDRDNPAMMMQQMQMMMGLMVESMARSMAKPEVAQNMAAFTRNYYQALIKAGFTQEEAMKIVLSSGLPHLGSK